MTPPRDVPPHDLAAERAILGALLVWPDESMPLVLGRLETNEFFLEAHRIVYRSLKALADAGAGLSVETLQDALVTSDTLADAGGPQALALLVEAGALATATSLTTLLVIVRRHAIARETTIVCRAALDEIAQGTTVDVLELSERLARLGERLDPEDLEPPDESLAKIADRMLLDTSMSLTEFVTYPIQKLNQILGGGSLPGELVYLGAGFGTGKTAIALEWAAYAAQHNHRVLIVSAEMTKSAVAARIIAQHAQIPANSFRSGELTIDEWDRARSAVLRMADWPVILDDRAMTLGAVRRLVMRHTPKLVIIDYLQLIRGPRQDDRRLEINAVSHGLKRIAKRFNCVVLVLSQLTLAMTKQGKPQRPDAGMLKESRGPSEDADTVLLLWRPDPERLALELIVGKGRSHRTGAVNLEFTPTYLWFREVTKETRHD